MELAVAIMSGVAAVASAVAAFLSYINGKKTASGNIEIQLRAMVSEAKCRYYLFIDKATERDGDGFLEKQFNTLQEELLNAYDEACAKYLDGKIDKKRFEYMYSLEIKQLVENPMYSHYYEGEAKGYEATLKFYNKLIDSEKNK